MDTNAKSKSSNLEATVTNQPPSNDIYGIIYGLVKNEVNEVKLDLRREIAKISDGFHKDLLSHETHYHINPDTNKREFISRFGLFMSLGGLTIISVAVYLVRYFVVNEIENRVNSKIEEAIRNIPVSSPNP